MSSDPTQPASGRSIDSFELPPLSSVGGGVEPFAVALGERRLRAALLGELLEPLRIDRFELEHQLGAGGMGTVWRAHDHQLARPVALKFLHARHASELGQRRFEREAQALARISHPNVVPVFDVGRHEAQTWIAMEFVPGQTLRGWATREHPSRARLLAAWLDAGRGLAAVHALGLVHRDIKPDNIMMGDDGRVRLVDFGLVCRASGVDNTELEASEANSSVSAGEDTLRTGVRSFVGTPAYAAPEQLDGRSVDARSDQYAFCVSLWEALCGERPTPDEGPHGGADELPLRVRKALVRGLERAPEARFDDMESLLRALAPPRRRWLAPTIAGVIAGSLGLALATFAHPEELPVDPCALASNPIAAVWNDARRTQLDARLGPQLGPSVAAIIEAWTQDWRASAQRSCEAHFVDGLESRARHDHRQACLAGAGARLERLLEGVETGELERAEVLAAWLSELPEPARCESKVLTQLHEGEAPAALREEIEQLDETLVRLRHDLDTQPLHKRLDAIAELLEHAKSLDWAPLVRDAALLSGDLSLLAGDETRARQSLGLALDLGLRHADAELVRGVQAELARVELLLAVDPKRGAWRIDREAALIDESSRPSALAVLAENQGLLAHLRGDLDAAEQAYSRAAAQWHEAGANFGWARAGSLRHLAGIHDERGHADEARELFAAARALERLGHPAPAPDAAAYDEGVAAFNRGELDAAEPLLLDALARGRELGPHSLFVAQTHIALSGLYDARGALEPARAHALAAEEVLLASAGATHPKRSESLTALGVAHYRARDFGASVTAFERVLAIAQRDGARVPGSVDYSIFELNLGDALYELGGQDLRARELLEHALAVLESQLGPEHPVLAVAIKPLGGLALRRGDAHGAVALLERASSLEGAGANSPVERAEISWLLAQALLAAGDRVRAQAEGASARAAFDALGPPWRPRAEQIQTWLAEPPTKLSSTPSP